MYTDRQRYYTVDKERLREIQKDRQRDIEGDRERDIYIQRETERIQRKRDLQRGNQMGHQRAIIFSVFYQRCLLFVYTENNLLKYCYMLYTLYISLSPQITPWEMCVCTCANVFFLQIYMYVCELFAHTPVVRNGCADIWCKNVCRLLFCKAFCMQIQAADRGN